MSKLSKTVEYTDDQVKHAIELIISEPFQAMCLANAFSGTVTPEWEIIYNFSIEEIFSDAIDRCIKLRGLCGSVGGRRIEDSWAKKYLPQPVDTKTDDGSTKWIYKDD